MSEPHAVSGAGLPRPPDVLGALGESMPVAAGLVDADLRVVQANAALVRLVGVSARMLKGAALPTVLDASADDIERVVRGALNGREAVLGRRLGPAFAPATQPGSVWSLTAFPVGPIDGGEPLVGILVEEIAGQVAFEAEQARAAASAALVVEAGLAVGTTLDTAATVGEVRKLLVPAFADHVAVHIAGEPLDDVSRIGDHLARQVLATGLPVVGPATARFGAEDRFHSVACVPLAGARQIAGVLLAFAEGGRAAYTEGDLKLLEDVGARLATSLDHARAFEAERRTAIELQRSLLPRVPALPTVRIASRYVPAQRAEAVGGDWFDVIPGAAGRVAFVIGDVIGHGVRAAATMGQLRTAVRTLAATDPSPGELLARVERVVHELDLAPFATCLYAVYDPARRSLDIASAGHLPPILLDRDGVARVLDDLPVEPPLGVSGGVIPSYSVPDVDGATLVMFTDGLVELRHHDIDARLAMLRRCVAAPAASLEARCEAVLSDMAPAGGGRDDIALVMAELVGLPADAIVEWTLPAEPASVQVARDRVAKLATTRGLLEERETLVLLTSELITNAVRYGRGPIVLRLFALPDRLTCEVQDEDPAAPAMREPGFRDPASPEAGGWGLNLVQVLATRWGTRSIDSGKIVWFELEFGAENLRGGV